MLFKLLVQQKAVRSDGGQYGGHDAGPEPESCKTNCGFRRSNTRCASRKIGSLFGELVGAPSEKRMRRSRGAAEDLCNKLIWSGRPMGGWGFRTMAEPWFAAVTIV